MIYLIIYLAIALYVAGYAFARLEGEDLKVFWAIVLGLGVGLAWLPLALYVTAWKKAIIPLYMMTPLYAYQSIRIWRGTKTKALSEGRPESLSRAVDRLIRWLTSNRPNPAIRIMLGWLAAQKQEDWYVNE